MSGWQPIETAPRGRRTIVLLYAPNEPVDWQRVQAGYWEDFDPYQAQFDPCWVTSFETEPTHWMPLPPAPVQP